MLFTAKTGNQRSNELNWFRRLYQVKAIFQTQIRLLKNPKSTRLRFIFVVEGSIVDCK